MSKIRYSNRGKVIEDSDNFSIFVSEHGLEAQDNLVLLTKQNADKIEDLVRNDDDYFPFAQKLFDYYGFSRVKVNKDKSLFAVVREIDRDNSTNVWRYRTNRDSFNKMISYITESKNDFFDRLEKGETTLPDLIVDQCGTGLKSLSSKVCKYLCEFAFQKDNYYINDKTIRHILLFYLDFYHIDHSEINSVYAVDKMDYQTLCGWLSKLHIARNETYKDKITKSELDHILWYCYKSFDL